MAAYALKGTKGDHQMYMKRALVTSLTLAISLGPLVPAGLAQDKADLTAVYKIKDEGLNHSQVMETLSYLTDVHGPRLSGSPGIRGAQQWAQDQLKKWGMENVATHQYAFGPAWTLKRFSAHMVAPQYAPLIAYPKAWSPGFANGPIKGQAIRVDIATEADLDKYKGKLKGMYLLTQPARDVEAHFNALGSRWTADQLAAEGTQPDPRAPFVVPGGGRGGRGGQPA